MKNKLVLSLLCATAIGGSAGWAATSTIQTIGSGEKWDSARQKVIGNFQNIESRLAALEAKDSSSGVSTATAATSASPSKKAPPPPPPRVTYSVLGTSLTYFKNDNPSDTKLYSNNTGTEVVGAVFRPGVGTANPYWLLNNGDGDLVRSDGTVMPRVDLGDGKFAYRGKGGSLSNSNGTRYVERMKGSFKKDHYVDSKGRVYSDSAATAQDTRFALKGGTDFADFEFEKNDTAKGKTKTIAADGSQAYTAGDKATKGLRKDASGKVTDASGAEVVKGSSGLYDIPLLSGVGAPGGTSGGSTGTDDTSTSKTLSIDEARSIIKAAGRSHINATARMRTADELNTYIQTNGLK